MVPEQLLAWLKQANRISVLTGAGMSAESGVPTFRDSDSSLWSRYDPMTMATPEAFEEDPQMVWAWYLHRMRLIRAVEPNSGHLALASLGVRRHVEIVTQNVDDLHERAGSTVLAHLHGSLFETRCFDCDEPVHLDLPELDAEDDVPERVQPPFCNRCGGLIRPGVVWFGEILPPDAFERSMDACTNSDLMLVVGTSGIVQPAATLPLVAGGAGVPLVEINPVETNISDEMDICWRVTAAEGLPLLLDALDA